MSDYITCTTLLLFGLYIFQETFTSDLFGDITPINSKIVLNGILELNCTLKDGLNASTLYWETPEGKAPRKIMFIIANNTLQLRKKVISVAEEGTYICKSTTEKQISKSPRANVFVEYEAVRNVTDLTCMVDRDKEELQCRWTIGTYNHEEYLSIMASVSFDNGYSYLDCPEKSPKESCTWSEEDGDIYALWILIKLTITNREFKVTKSFTDYFRGKEILRLRPPRDINLSLTASCTCVSLTWSVGERFIATTTKIILNSKWNATSEAHMIDKNITAMTCDLIPATAYELDLQQKPIVGFYYSDSTTAKFNTCVSAPTHGPWLSSSGYLSERCDSPLESREVTIYWKKIPEKAQNGAICNYTVTTDGFKNQSFGASNFSGSVLVPCEGRHNISVTGCNSAGCSPYSSIIVREYNELHPPEKLIVEQVDADKMSLSWFGSQGVSKVHIIWCKGEAAVQKCRGEINVLPKDTSLTGNHALVSKNKISTSDSFDEIIFGVALLNGTELSSGIRWQETCRYTKGIEIKKPSNVRLLPDPPDDSLTVSWSRTKCDRTTAKNAYVNSYRIQYCQLDDHDNCKGNKGEAYLPADGMTRYTIKSLEAEKKYGVWVAAVSLTMNNSNSDMIIGIPRNNRLRYSTLSFIVVGSVFGFIFAIIGLVCITREVYRKLGFQETFPIQTVQIEGCKQNKQENGLFIGTGQPEEHTSFLETEVSDCDVKYSPFTRPLSQDSGHSSISSTLPDSQSPNEDTLMKEQENLSCDHKKTFCKSEKEFKSGAVDYFGSSSRDRLTCIPPVKDNTEYQRSCDKYKVWMDKYKCHNGYIKYQQEDLEFLKEFDYLTNNTLVTEGKIEHPSSNKQLATEEHSFMEDGYLRNTAIPTKHGNAETVSDYEEGKLLTNDYNEFLLEECTSIDVSNHVNPIGKNTPTKTEKKHTGFTVINNEANLFDSSEDGLNSVPNYIQMPTINPVSLSGSLSSSTNSKNDLGTDNCKFMQTENLVNCNDSYIPFEASLQQSHLCY